MVMTILARMAGADTSGTPWYAAGMNWAKANGVSDGTNTTASVTREQLVTMLFRYAAAHGMKSVTLEENLSRFTDKASVSAWGRPGDELGGRPGADRGFERTPAPAGERLARRGRGDPDALRAENRKIMFFPGGADVSAPPFLRAAQDKIWRRQECEKISILFRKTVLYF